MERGMKKGGAFLVWICLIVVFGFGAAWADEPEQSTSTQDYQVFELGEIFVTADQVPTVQETAITTELTAEEIRATNSQTAAEALEHVPGIRVSTGRKNESHVEIHGMAQEKVLVLIDGVPYYETRYGRLDLNQIPVDNIARIEVTKGAPSVLYGPNALMGVINIITKKATDKVVAQATVEVGPYNTNRESITHGQKVGLFNYWLNYSHKQTDGWKLSDDFQTQEATIRKKPGGTQHAYVEDGGYRANSDYDQHSLWAKIGIDPGPGSEYYVNAHYITKEKGDPPSIYGGNHFPNAPAFSQVYDRITKYEDWGLDFSGQQKIVDRFTLKGKLFYHHHTDDYTSYSDQSYDEDIAVSRYKDYILGGYLSGDLRPVEWDILRFAFHYKGDSHKERADEYLPFEDYFSTTGSVALENEFNLVKNLSVVLGVSYDWYDVTKAVGTNDDGSQYDREKPDIMDGWGPMIGATYTFADSTKLFGSIAQKVRFPTLDQLYSSKGGNLDLDPERAVNYTLGISRSFSKYASVELAWFYHDISDYISRDANPNYNPDALYQNFADIDMTGVELSAEFYPLADFPLWKDLKLWGAYTYNHARDNSEDHVTSRVVNVPMQKVDLGIHLTIPYIKTGLDIVGIYMDEFYDQLPTAADPTQERILVDDYFTMNLRISKSFLKHFEAYAAINNIFDRDYETDYGYPAPGRNFYIGLTAKY